DLSATADLDITTVDALRELAAGLRRRGIGLRLAQVRGSVRDRMLVTGLMADLGEEAVFIALDEAVAAPLPTAEPATLAPGTPPAEASEAEASEPGPP
ncbi:MAG: sodium-independent anion transporter, partial [Candidatus Limnocylindrales bacterium]